MYRFMCIYWLVKTSVSVLSWFIHFISDGYSYVGKRIISSLIYVKGKYILLYFWERKLLEQNKFLMSCARFNLSTKWTYQREGMYQIRTSPVKSVVLIHAWADLSVLIVRVERAVFFHVLFRVFFKYKYIYIYMHLELIIYVPCIYLVIFQSECNSWGNGREDDDDWISRGC